MLLMLFMISRAHPAPLGHVTYVSATPHVIVFPSHLLGEVIGMSIQSQ